MRPFIEIRHFLHDFLSKLAIYPQRFHEIHIFCDFYWNSVLFLDILSKLDFSRLFYEIRVFSRPFAKILIFSHDFFSKLTIFCLCLMKFAIFCASFYQTCNFPADFFYEIRVISNFLSKLVYVSKSFVEINLFLGLLAKSTLFSRSVVRITIFPTALGRNLYFICLRLMKYASFAIFHWNSRIFSGPLRKFAIVFAILCWNLQFYMAFWLKSCFSAKVSQNSRFAVEICFFHQVFFLTKF